MRVHAMFSYSTWNHDGEPRLQPSKKAEPTVYRDLPSLSAAVSVRRAACIRPRILPGGGKHFAAKPGIGLTAGRQQELCAVVWPDRCVIHATLLLTASLSVSCVPASD